MTTGRWLDTNIPSHNLRFCQILLHKRSLNGRNLLQFWHKLPGRGCQIKVSKSRSSTSREKKVLSPIFHCEIFISSHRHLQKICWKACNLEQIDFQVHRLLFHPENCYLEGFNLYFLYSKLHIFYKYIRMVWWNVVQDSAGMRITLQQPHYWWVTLGTLNISRVKYSCVA